MTITIPSRAQFAEITTTAERGIIWTAINAAPIITLLSTGYILQDHLAKYAQWDGGFAWCAAIGAELTGLAIMATKTDRQRRGLPVVRMDKAFCAYVVIVVVVNGVLALFNITSAADVGKLLAELALGLIAIPVAQMVSDRHELQAIDQAEQDTAAKETAQAAQAFDNTERVKDNEHRRDMETKAAEAAEVLRMKEFEARELANARAERAATKSAKVAVAPAVVAVAEPEPKVATKQPCKFGCGKLVTGTAGQNAHSDKCPNNPANASGKGTATK